MYIGNNAFDWFLDIGALGAIRGETWYVGGSILGLQMGLESGNDANKQNTFILCLSERSD
jgi:hypothetical protein